MLIWMTTSHSLAILDLEPIEILAVITSHDDWFRGRLVIIDSIMVKDLVREFVVVILDISARLLSTPYPSGTTASSSHPQ